MLNKNDPLIAAVQKVMQTNQAEREAVAVVNEKFGVADRRALPRERQHEWDSAYAKVLTEGVEALDELKGITNNTGARAKYMVKGIGSAVKAKLTGDEKTYAKRMKGLEGAKEKSEADTERRKKDASNNETARKVLKDMGRKTGYGKIYDKMFEEEALDEKVKMTKSDIAGMRHPKKKITGDDLAALRAGEHKMEEEKKMKGNDPCWKGYEMVGMKKKGGKEVPNCVPVKEENVNEVAPPGAKYERMVNHIKKKMSKGGLTKKEKSIAYATAWKAKNKNLEEGFNNRHDFSVTASAEKQVVADQLNEKASPAVIAADKKRNPRKGETLGNIVRPLIPGVDAAIKAKEGDYAGAAKSAAFDVGTTLAGGVLGRTALKYGSKAFNYLRGAPKTAPATSQVANNFRANVANRRYNVAGAQQRPPQSVTPAAQPVTQSSVPSVAQGSGQANRLAAIRRPESGPWGSAQAATSGSKLRVPPGGFAANLQRARQQAQASRAGVNTAQATQAATRAASARQSSQALGGLGQASNATNILRARQSSQALGGFGRATSSLGNIVRKNPKLAAGAAAGAAMTGFAATKVGNQPPKAQAQTSTAGKDKPGTGPGQGSGAPTGPENIKMATQNTQGSYDKMTFSQAFAAARKQAGGAGGKFKYKGKEYQTNVKGTGTTAKPQEKYQAASKLKTVAPPTQTTTTKSVAGGQGIAALPSGPAKSAAPVPTARPANVGSTGPARPTMAANAQAAGQMAVDRMKSQSSGIDTRMQKGPDTSFNARYNYSSAKSTPGTDVRSPSNPEKIANPTFVPDRNTPRKSAEVRQDITSSLNSRQKPTFGGPR